MSEVMELKRTVLKVNIYGEDCMIDFPNLLQIKKISKLSGDDAIDKMIDFLSELGLKKEISEQMEVPHLEKIIETLSSRKKN